MKGTGIYQNIIKRCLDVVVSLIVFPFLILLFIVVAPLIYFADKGPIFYNAPRLGYKGKNFRMYKFRSMKVNAPDLRNNDGTTWNSKDDPRVTRIGKVLRKTSIDEIPQILNVLKGDMSIVGPRPDLPDAIDLLNDETKAKLNVLPGITGYSQVHYRNTSTLDERFYGDLYYATHVSFLLDIKLIVQTIIAVIKKKNIYRN